MDRPGPRSRGIAVAGAILLLAAGALAQAASPSLRAQRWLAAGVDPVRALTRQPAECLILPQAPARRLSVEVGRAAFRSPTVLGGQAARAGLACETCHRAGRTNRDFAFPGVSGAAGTADVTSSLFSTHRGDGVFNPRPIPDLAGTRSALKIDQAPEGRVLEGFIHGLVTQEFDGPEPTPAVLDGLADYVRALSHTACPRPEDAAITLEGLMDDARRAVDAAARLAAVGDRASAVVMVQAGRARLFLIDERYADPGLARERGRLKAADHVLGDLAEALRRGAPEATAGLARWTADSKALEAALARREPLSLFNPRRLAAATDGRLPRRPS